MLHRADEHQGAAQQDQAQHPIQGLRHPRHDAADLADDGLQIQHDGLRKLPRPVLHQVLLGRFKIKTCHIGFGIVPQLLGGKEHIKSRLHPVPIDLAQAAHAGAEGVGTLQKLQFVA